MTQFVETNTLLAVLDGDLNEARRLLSDFFLGELCTFGEAVATLMNLVNEEIDKHQEAQ